MARRRPTRLLAVVAVGFLLLDAVLLTVAAWWGGRPGLLVFAVGCAAGATGVVILYRRYLARLDEIAEARAALEREAGALGRALRRER